MQILIQKKLLPSFAKISKDQQQNFSHNYEFVTDTLTSSSIMYLRLVIEGPAVLSSYAGLEGRKDNSFVTYQERLLSLQ